MLIGGEDILLVRVKRGCTCLNVACESGEAVKVLLDAFEVSGADFFGLVGLSCAASPP